MVRADFLGRLIAYPPLKAALDAGPFTVGPMSEAELRLAITGPAAEAGLAIEPALTDTVIAELREEAGGGLGSGALPLMSQAMAATWEHREGNELTLRGYRRTGGVADAVNRGAQAAYDALTSAQKDAARLVFTQLTVVTPDGQLARRRCRRADLRAAGAQLAADIDTVLGIFSARRLLVLGEDHVEISHDVLLYAGNSSGTGSETTSSTGPCTARSSPTRRPGIATAGTPPTCTGRGGWPPSTPRPPAGRTRPPATSRCRPPARRSSALRTTPRVAPPGGGAA